jgi:hypothetical protein
MDSYGLPPQIVERVVCSVSAAVKYDIPADIVLAVAEKEKGKPGQRNLNSNGSYDIGSMQLNTNYLKDLARYGITPDDVAVSGCYPFELAAWRLRKHLLNDDGDIWTRAANYHSRTPEYNQTYRADLMVRAAKWASWLKDRFKTSHVVDGIDSKSPTKSDRKLATQLPHTQKNISDMNREYKNVASSTYVPRGLILRTAE